MRRRIYFSSILICCSLAPALGQSLKRIFYSTFRPQNWDIYISTDAGKKFEKFTDHPSLDYDAVISPDGKWVVFTSERSGIPQLYIKPVQGDQAPVNFIRSNSFQDQAVFSPDGSQLAFVSSHEGNSDIYLLPFIPDSIQDIGSAINLTSDPGGDFRPSFSPNGKMLAFSSDRGHEIVPHVRYPFARQRKGDVYSMDISGKNLTRLTNSDHWDGSPIWSSDGQRIIFYSDRMGKSSLFEMKADGSDQKQLFEYELPCVSPKLLANGNLVFTTWSSEQDFKIMQFDQASKEIKPLMENGPDLMFNMDVNPNGVMVFHGGTKVAPNNFGFDGDVLAKAPDTIAFAGQTTMFYGVRRAFVAPPMSGENLLVYDASGERSLSGFLKPLGFSILILPLFIAFLFLSGIYFGIRKRKQGHFWKYTLYSVSSVILGLVAGGIFIYLLAISPKSVNTIRMVMGVLTIVLILIAWLLLRKSRSLQASGNRSLNLSGAYSRLFIGLAIFALMCTVFVNQFFQTSLHFYQVDFLTGEDKFLFTLEKEANTNPSSFSVLDSKIGHDGKTFTFTTGSFRADPLAPGDIWTYDMEQQKVTKLSESPYNDGFGDFSENGKMVFRSGKTGFFDIYLKSNGETVNLTNDQFRDNFPAISKQGDKIVFASDRLRSTDEYKTMDIFLMKLNADNTWTDPEKISTGKGQNAHAHFSPDGEWIIYTTEGYGINDEQSLIQPIIFSPQMYGEIVAYHINSGERHRLTHNKWEEGTPLWVE